MEKPGWLVRIESVFNKRYGQIPDQQKAEVEQYPELSENGEYLFHQEVIDISRIARLAKHTGESDIKETAFQRYHELTGKTVNSIDELQETLDEAEPEDTLSRG